MAPGMPQTLIRADVARPPPDVRFAPGSGPPAGLPSDPLCANRRQFKTQWDDRGGSKRSV